MGQAPDELTGHHAEPGSPRQIEQDIAGTRSALSADLDELTDRLSPSNVAHRQVDKVKDRANDLKERVMGSAHDAADTVRSKVGDVQDRAGGTAGELRGAAGDARHSAADAASDAKGAVTDKTRGNPLAAGVIAFGAGWLLSSLLPASEKEARATSRAVDAAKEHGGAVESVKGAVKDAVLDVRGGLQEHAASAAQQVAQVAKDGAQSLKSDAQDAAAHVKEHGQTAAGEVKDQGQAAAGEVRQTAQG